MDTISLAQRLRQSNVEVAVGQEWRHVRTKAIHEVERVFVDGNDVTIKFHSGRTGFPTTCTLRFFLATHTLQPTEGESNGKVQQGTD